MPKNPGSAPWSLIKASASLSKYKVVTPGFISEAIIPKVLETINALSRINSISSLVFWIIIYCNLTLFYSICEPEPVCKSNYFSHNYSVLAMNLNSVTFDFNNQFSSGNFDLLEISKLFSLVSIITQFSNLVL
jgi:hypothetical protein